MPALLSISVTYLLVSLLALGCLAQARAQERTRKRMDGTDAIRHE